MDYITKHYKNLSEDLQRRLEALQQYITEMQAAQMAQGDVGAMATATTAMEQPSGNVSASLPPVIHEFLPGQPHFPIPGDGSRYPQGRNDPSYHEDYFEYLRWYRMQSKEYQKRNPMPPPMPPLPIRKPPRDRPSRGSGAPGGPRR